MSYEKGAAPVGGTLPERQAYLDRELGKIRDDLDLLEVVIEALLVTGIETSYFWDDTIVGDPGVSHMAGDTNVLATITQFRVSFIDALDHNIPQTLRSRAISVGDKIEVNNQAGNGHAIYTVTADPVFTDTHYEIPVVFSAGESGNPQIEDLMHFKWNFFQGSTVQTP